LALRDMHAASAIRQRLVCDWGFRAGSKSLKAVSSGRIYIPLLAHLGPHGSTLSFLWHESGMNNNTNMIGFIFWVSGEFFGAAIGVA
jgi:hypothetical protein